MGLDASDTAIGTCLSHVIGDVEHPICYMSKKLNKPQKNYSTVEKRACGLLTAFKVFNVYFGSMPVVVYTDHIFLQFLQRMSNFNQNLLRWNLELQEYNLTIKHRFDKNIFCLIYLVALCKNVSALAVHIFMEGVVLLYVLYVNKPSSHYLL